MFCLSWLTRGATVMRRRKSCQMSASSPKNGEFHTTYERRQLNSSGYFQPVLQLASDLLESFTQANALLFYGYAASRRLPHGHFWLGTAHQPATFSHGIQKVSDLTLKQTGKQLSSAISRSQTSSSSSKSKTATSRTLGFCSTMPPTVQYFPNLNLRNSNHTGNALTTFCSTTTLTLRFTTIDTRTRCTTSIA